MRVLYLYRSSRAAVERAAAAGETADTSLYGLNQLRILGVSAEFFDMDRKWQERRWGVLPLVERTVVKRTGFGWNLRQALAALWRMRQFDVVFATTDSTGLPLAFLKRVLRVRKPLVMASQGLSNSRRVRGPNWAFSLHRWCLKAVDAVIVYGRHEREDLIQQFDLSADKVHWIPFGVDTGFLLRQPVPDEKDKTPFALSVGRDSQRDWTTLKEAIEKLSIPFRVVTSAHSWPAENRVPRTEVFYDLPMVDLCRLYARSRLVVLTLRENNYSFATTTLIEAMVMGKPVVVSRTRAMGSEDDGYGLVDGVHCRLVSPGDAAALAEVIEQLWNSVDERKTLAMAGKKWALEHGSMALATRILGILKKAACLA